ncbi:hypothetical protein C0Q70_08832 [Pomacea canaliculata]|uniref:Epidermal growth factor-like domain-containing protein n=1 Tax=Pomacea canaliculata TaxID=400727 RepID=A0A2T7P834_POMCA|nr:hypothetical protein C0Q70_08832 [Pomacea canaliculata]
MACAASENGKVCGGNGACRCGKCECDVDYTGHTCTCPLSNSTCIDTSNTADKVCSGHGVCECGSCKCERGYSGKYCAECPLCGKTVCEVNWECVRCNIDKPDAPACPENCPPVTKVLDIDGSTPGVCPEHIDSCLIHYSIQDTEGNITIRMQDQPGSLPERHQPVDCGWRCGRGSGVGGAAAADAVEDLDADVRQNGVCALREGTSETQLGQGRYLSRENNPLYKEVTTTYHNPTVDPGPGTEDF